MNSNTEHISKKRKKSTRTNLNVDMDVYERSLQNEAFDAYFDWLKEQIMSDDIDELDDYSILISKLAPYIIEEFVAVKSYLGEIYKIRCSVTHCSCKCS